MTDPIPDATLDEWDTAPIWMTHRDVRTLIAAYRESQVRLGIEKARTKVANDLIESLRNRSEIEKVEKYALEEYDRRVAVEADLAALRAAIEALHQPFFNDYDGHLPKDKHQTCRYDGEPWPCRTASLLSTSTDRADGEACACVGYTIRTDYGTGVEHDVDKSECPIHSREDR